MSILYVSNRAHEPVPADWQLFFQPGTKMYLDQRKVGEIHIYLIKHSFDILVAIIFTTYMKINHNLLNQCHRAVANRMEGGADRFYCTDKVIVWIDCTIKVIHLMLYRSCSIMNIIPTSEYIQDLSVPTQSNAVFFFGLRFNRVKKNQLLATKWRH